MRVPLAGNRIGAHSLGRFGIVLVVATLGAHRRVEANDRTSGIEAGGSRERLESAESVRFRSGVLEKVGRGADFRITASELRVRSQPHVVVSNVLRQWNQIVMGTRDESRQHGFEGSREQRVRAICLEDDVAGRKD